MSETVVHSLGICLPLKEFVLKLLQDHHNIPQIMAKHIASVKEALQNGQELTRDMFLHEADVWNVATKLAQETYMLDSNDAKSVRLWVQQNCKDVFHYQETSGAVLGELTSSNMPFTIRIQNGWQREMILRHGHHSGVAMDATFGINEKKVAFVFTSKSAEANLMPWMRSLNKRLTSEMPLWKPNAFIVDYAPREISSLRTVWPYTAIFLCLWHVH